MAQRRGAFTRCALHVAVLAMTASLLLAGFQPRPARADDATEGDSRLQAPIADVLSASSWLWATGQDPRRPAASAAHVSWLDAWAQADMAAPAGNATVTKVSGQVPVTSEPSLAIDPANPDHLVLAVCALDLPSVATYVSDDGGQTWDGPVQVPYFSGDSASLGAPEIIFGEQGALYLVSRSVAIEHVAVGLQQLPIERVRIAVSRSDDGGRQWGNAVSAVVTETQLSLFLDESGLMSGSIDTAFLDSPAVAVGPDPQRPDQEIISIAYAELRTSFILLEAADRVRLSGPATESTIRVVRSSDGGENWSEPIAASETVSRAVGTAAPPADAPEAGTPQEMEPPVAPAASSAVAGGNQVVQGPDLVVFADGAIAVAYFDSTRDGPHQGLARVMVAVSTDGARTFSEPRQAGLFREIPAHPATAFFRWWDGSFPRFVVGPEDAFYIFVAAGSAGESAGAGQLRLFRSLNRGEQWDALGLALGDAGNRFFPAIEVAADGTLFAVWGQLGSDPAGAGYRIQAAQSTDQGETWNPITDDGSHADEPASTISGASANALIGFPRGQYLGGRLAIVTADGVLFAAWPAARQPERGGFGQQIDLARVPVGAHD